MTSDYNTAFCKNYEPMKYLYKLLKLPAQNSCLKYQAEMPTLNTCLKHDD